MGGCGRVFDNFNQQFKLIKRKIINLNETTAQLQNF
jgi:hypothetical protein